MIYLFFLPFKVKKRARAKSKSLYSLCLNVGPHHSVSGWLSMSAVVWWFLGRGRMRDWGGCYTSSKIQISKKQMKEKREWEGGRKGRKKKAGWWCSRNVLGCSRALRAKRNRLQKCHNKCHIPHWARLPRFSTSAMFASIWKSCLLTLSNYGHCLPVTSPLMLLVDWTSHYDFVLTTNKHA